MDLVVQRKWLTPQSTCGELSIDGGFFCHTLEPRIDQSRGKPYCIPAGTYELALRASPRLGYVTPWVKEVPGFEDILIHIGNYPKDTEGCTLVGEFQHQEIHLVDFVGYSKHTFAKLMETLKLPAKITYKDAE